MTKTQLLRLIGTGKYDSEIPSDYLTSRMLFQCMADGLVEASYVKNDDLFWLTERGKSACVLTEKARKRLDFDPVNRAEPPDMPTSAEW